MPVALRMAVAMLVMAVDSVATIVVISLIVGPGSRLCGWPATMACDWPVVVWWLATVPAALVGVVACVGLARWVRKQPTGWYVPALALWPVVFVTMSMELGPRQFANSDLVVSSSLSLAGSVASLLAVSRWWPRWKSQARVAILVFAVGTVGASAALPFVLQATRGTPR